MGKSAFALLLAADTALGSGVSLETIERNVFATFFADTKHFFTHARSSGFNIPNLIDVAIE